jgi:hypothetical protein
MKVKKYVCTGILKVLTLKINLKSEFCHEYVFVVIDICV